MPYFTDLHALLTELTEWADLRHEQGADIAGPMTRLRAELRRARSTVRGAKPPAATRRKEPNELDAIRALRPGGPRRLRDWIPRAQLRRRLRGAWLGRAAGCTLGAPVEGWPIEQMARLAKRCRMAFPPRDYWKDHPLPDNQRYGVSVMQDYLKGHIRGVPVDDDVTYTLLGLLILEDFGPAFTTDDIGKAWLKYLPMACTAEHVALENLKAGVPAAKAALKSNPYQEWIGADIRSDPWGYAAPGWPERAAEMAYRDAYLTHRQNGIYGAMLFAAAISAAFVVDSPVEAVRIGLTEIPKACRLARDVRWALRTGTELKDWRQARAAVDARFKGMSAVHTNNNACLTVFGLMLAGRVSNPAKAFTEAIGITVAMGLDNDCTAATVGSILGAVIGGDNIPPHWWRPFRNRTRTYLRGHEWFTNTGIVERFMRMADAVCG